MAKKSEAHISKAPVRKLMKKSGVNLIAANAVKAHLKNQHERVTKLTKKAQLFATHAKRKKIQKTDMELAIKYL